MSINHTLWFRCIRNKHVFGCLSGIAWGSIVGYDMYSNVIRNIKERFKKPSERKRRLEAVLVIQRKLREALYNPTYKMCRDRIKHMYG